MKPRLQYKDHFGRKIKKDCVVVFTKVGKEGKTEKKTALMCDGIVIELVNKNSEPSVKIEDPRTHKISHVRKLDNIVVMADRQLQINAHKPPEVSQ